MPIDQKLLKAIKKNKITALYFWNENICELEAQQLCMVLEKNTSVRSIGFNLNREGRRCDEQLLNAIAYKFFALLSGKKPNKTLIRMTGLEGSSYSDDINRILLANQVKPKIFIDLPASLAYTPEPSIKLVDIIQTIEEHMRSGRFLIPERTIEDCVDFYSKIEEKVSDILERKQCDFHDIFEISANYHDFLPIEAFDTWMECYHEEMKCLYSMFAHCASENNELNDLWGTFTIKRFRQAAYMLVDWDLLGNSPGVVEVYVSNCFVKMATDFRVLGGSPDEFLSSMYSRDLALTRCESKENHLLIASEPIEVNQIEDELEQIALEREASSQSPVPPSRWTPFQRMASLFGKCRITPIQGSPTGILDGAQTPTHVRKV